MRRKGRRQIICNEGTQEGLNRPEGQNNRAHKNRASGPGLGAPIPLSGHTLLCIPDGRQAPSHSRLVPFDPKLTSVYLAIFWLSQFPN